MAFYIVVPQDVYSKYPSPGNLYGLLLVLCRKDGYCYVQNKYLADALEIKIRTLQDYLKKLQDDKLIRVEIENNNKRRITTLDTFRATKRVKPTSKINGKRQNLEPDWLAPYLDEIEQMQG